MRQTFFWVGFVLQMITLAGLFFLLVSGNPSLLPACATEDSMNCFWDATLRGNKRGQSFFDVLGWAFMV